MQTIMKRLKRDKRGISTVIVVMLSLVLVVIIVGNVVLWNYQMNQFDLERIKEASLKLTNVASSALVTAQSEYMVNAGVRLSGSYIDTREAGSGFEEFREETALSNSTFNPSDVLNSTNQLISGTVADLATDNGVYMIFRSYPSGVTARTLFCHNETTTIASSIYYQLRSDGADSAGSEFLTSADSTGRKLLAKFVYPLSGITSIPASTWTIYYRAKADNPVDAFCNVDILIKRSDGTNRTIIATEVARSSLLANSYSTVSGTYSWSNYSVVNQTDFLEIDFYAVVTRDSPQKEVSLRIDDSTLATSDQTRISGVMLPTSQVVQLELSGSGSIQSGHSLVWTLNSAFTAANVTTTLQLYNYNKSRYPESGDGYISYTSSSTANIDETKSQTITQNPTFYLDTTGAWKIRITAVKDTTLPFDFKIDWAEIKAAAAGAYRLNIVNDYVLNLQIYPKEYISNIEILVRYKVSSIGERWFLKAYNWIIGDFSDVGFNSTSGSQPAVDEWSKYAVVVTNNWGDYVNDEGIVRIEFFDGDLSLNQTVVSIDFLYVKATLRGVLFKIENSSSVTVHVVAVWVIDKAINHHWRYDTDLFLNSGQSIDYLREDIILPEKAFVAKIVTERGNIAVFQGG
ncbi:MAG: hypothetical protein QXU99_05285 [Candidatus Bathyarchaeia archaeon]